MGWDPFEDLKRFRKEMEKRFENISGSFEKSFNEMSKKFSRLNLKEPKTEISQGLEKVNVVLDLPGMKRADIFLQVTEDHLEVSAHKKQQSKIKKKGFSKEEASFTGYRRIVPLPANVVPEKAVATFKNGKLTVEIPKSKKKIVKKVAVA